MSAFTKSKWEAIPIYGDHWVVMDNKHTVIDCFGSEHNALLTAAAPEMYELLNSMCSYINALENIMPHFPDALSLFAKNGNQLLARIDGKEAPND